MHYMYLVLLDKQEATTSLEARQKTYNLLDEHGFTQGVYPFADFHCATYYIGGRWSGCLNFDIQNHASQARELILASALKDHSSEDDIEENLKLGLQKIWEEQGGQDQFPGSRSALEKHGYQDDARLLDDSLIEQLRARHEIRSMVADETPGMHMVILPSCTPFSFKQMFQDIDSCKDKYWLVVVDYAG